MSRNGFELVNGRVVPRPGYGLMQDGSLVENPVKWFFRRKPGKMVLK